MTDAYAAARTWIAADPDPDTRAAGQALLDSGDVDRFVGRLTFGTAGMRGPLGPGPNAMNRAMVRRVSLGLGRYLLDHVARASARGVAVGFDGRYGSRDFAADTAAVLAGLGLRVYLYDDVVPTPQLAHAVKHLGCAGGVMVTASHNPPGDNGYKVYWENGAQIIPPHDAGISACLDAVEGVPPAPQSDLVGPVPAAALEAYLTAVDGLRVYAGPTDLRVVYTAMHGVGRKLIETVLRRHGYDDLHVVASQGDPDPDFPTVAFPNPEEPGALDASLALAAEVGADLLVANDPDADRLAVAVPEGDGYRALTGNQIGVLLADELLRYGEGERRLVATTVVSSSMLRRVAAAYGADYAETLTGFKWLADRAIAHEATGGVFTMGYEEALGYSVGPVVRDKDGVSAALVFCDLAARCKAAGQTVLERLDGLYRAHGVHASTQRSVVADADHITATMDRLRATPPTDVGGVAVVAVIDYAPGHGGLPPTNLLAFELADGATILARPSGTEPKIKFYFEVRVDGSQAQADARLAGLVEAFDASV